jgi:hypothetical protein
MGHALGNNYGKFYSFLSKPVLVDLNFIVDSANGNGLGVRSVKGQGVENVFMHTTATAGKGPNGYLNPNPAVGLALIQLSYNYTRYYGGFSGFVSPLTGSALAINGSALTIGSPYVIITTGHGEAGTATIAPVADSSGSLASTWFSLYDNYGNTWIIWFSVSGVGARPNLGPAAADGAVGLHYVQQSIVTNDTAATIGADLVITIENLLSGIAGVDSFTASGTTTVTVVSTQHSPYQPLPGPPTDGTIPTGFTFAVTKYISNATDWANVGLPPGVVPSVGASFIATATGYSTGGGSTGTVKAPGVSGISTIEVIGDPNQSFGPIPIGGSAYPGAWILVQFLSDTSASVTTKIPTAPADNSVCGMTFYVEQAARVGGNSE